MASICLSSAPSVISALVWGRKVTFDDYVPIVTTSYLIKLAAAIIVTPLIYGLHELIERWFGIEPAAVEATADDEPRA